MTHRGPDGAGSWISPGVLLGHRRLAILDLSETAAQPMKSAQGTVLLLNGEIYNYIELRAQLVAEGDRFTSSGDTAVLLAALDRWGLEDTLQRVRGMFAFAVWRPVEQQLWLARDPVGKKPLFVAQHDSAITFSSTFESVLRWMTFCGYSPQVDPVAINHALATGWVPAPRTGLVGIRKVVPGTYEILTVAKPAQVKRYWRIPYPVQRFPLDRARQRHLLDLFDNAVSRRMRSDVPVATFLSGGLDSSLVAAAASRYQPRMVAYTARTHNKNDDEFILATEIAKYLGLEQRVVEVNQDLLDNVDHFVQSYGEVFCDSSAFPTAAISRAAGQEHRVVLTGDGGDEVQGGYTSATLFALRALVWSGDPLNGSVGRLRMTMAAALEDPVRRREGGLPAWRFRFLRLMTSPAAALVMRHDGLEESRAVMQPLVAASLGDQEWCAWVLRRIQDLEASSGIDTRLGLDFSTYLPDDLNTKLDVASMASSVEARCPLQDIDFVNACWGVRTWDRVRPWARKRIVRNLARHYLPSRLLIRRKQGFSVPIARLLERAGAVDETLQSLRRGTTGLEGMLDTEVVASLIASDRRAGREPTELTWRVIVLGHWVKWINSNLCGTSVRQPAVFQQTT